MRHSILNKLLASYIAVVVISMGLSGLIVTLFLHDYFLQAQREELIKQGQAVSSLLGAWLDDTEELDRQVVLLNRVYQASGTGVVVLDSEGSVIAPAHLNVEVQLDKGDLQAVKQDEVVFCKSGFTGLDNRIGMLLPFKSAKQGDPSILIYAPVGEVGQITARVITALAYGGTGALLLVGVVGMLLSRSITGPLRRMSQAALGMAVDDFGQRVEVNTRDEVGSLGRAFNVLAEKLEHTLRKLRLERIRLGSILSSVQDGVVALDEKKRVVLVNSRAAGWLGLSRTDTGEWQGSLNPELSGALAQALDGNSVNIQFLAKETEISARVSPVLNNGEGMGAVALLQDQRESWKLEQSRRQFVSVVSHELRTPLTLVQGYVQALLDGMDKKRGEREKYLRIISKEAERLNRIVADLLDLAQIESGKLPLRMKTFEVSQLLHDVTQRHWADSRARIEVECASGQHLVLGDRDRLLQALLNLVDNALRFSPVNAKVRLGIQSTQGGVWVWVKDEGQGIPAWELSQLWDKFYRADRGAGCKAGTGLGLAIVKEILERHGGKVDVTSAPGLGTRFAFWLPTLGRTDSCEVQAKEAT